MLVTLCANTALRTLLIVTLATLVQGNDEETSLPLLRRGKVTIIHKYLHWNQHFRLVTGKRFSEWNPELLVEVDNFNAEYIDTTAACFSLIMGKNYTERPVEVSQGKYGAVQYMVDTLLVMKCATIADLIIAPWNIVEDWLRFPILLLYHLSKFI